MIDDEARERIARVRAVLREPGIRPIDIAHALGVVLVNLLCNCSSTVGEADAAIDELSSGLKASVHAYFDAPRRGRVLH